MRHSARLFLDRKMGRRAFLSRLAHAGMASAAAARMARALEEEQIPSRASEGARRVHGLTGGELMAELLVDWGLPYVFGLGGSEEVGFLDALVDRPVHYAQGLHEGSVLAMADGYARASGGTPLVNLHSIAGAGYAFGPMVNAFKDRIPLVVTVGRQATALRGTNAFLEAVNLHLLPRDYTRWSWDVLRAETIPEVLRRAFVLSRVPPGGPTFLTFSKDLWEKRVERAEILPRSRSELDLGIEPSPEHVSQIADALVRAELPVISVGREASRFDPTEEILAVAELLGAPLFQDVYPSHTAVVLPTTHPLYAGMFNMDPTFPGAFDLYWSLGGTMFALMAAPSEPVLPRSTRTIHTGLDAEEIARTYPADIAVMANIKNTAAAVLEALRRRSLPRAAIDDRRRRVEAYHHERRNRLEKRAKLAWSQRPISTERLVLELNGRLDPEAILVSELITSEAYLPFYLDVDHRRGRRRRNFTTSGGVLGWGVAAAIGAKMARPEREVVALVGDGSFHFGVQALWSAARYEVPVGVVIFNNEEYQANRKFLHAYGGRAAATGRYVGCRLRPPEIDNVSIARGYGVEAESLDEPDAIAGAIDRCRKALTEGRPYVVDVKIERRFEGSDSSWYDAFSVAEQQRRGLAADGQ